MLLEPIDIGRERHGKAVGGILPRFYEERGAAGQLGASERIFQSICAAGGTDADRGLCGCVKPVFDTISRYPECGKQRKRAVSGKCPRLVERFAFLFQKYIYASAHGMHPHARLEPPAWGKIKKYTIG